MAPGVSLPAKIPLCSICGHEGYSNLLIFCAECDDLAVHRYCLEKNFSRGDKEVYWRCWECESRIDMRRAPKNRDEMHSSSKRNDSQRSYVTRSVARANQAAGNDSQKSYVMRSVCRANQEAGNDSQRSYMTRSASRANQEGGNDSQRSYVTRSVFRATQEMRNDSQRSYVTRSVSRANQGVREKIKKTNLNCILDRELTKEKGNLVSLDGCSRLRYSTYSFENYESGEQLIGFLDESEPFFPFKFTQKVHENGFSIDSRKKLQVIDLNKQEKRVQIFKRVILDDSSDSDDEYPFKEKQKKEKSRRRFILDESSSSEEDEVIDDSSDSNDEYHPKEKQKKEKLRRRFILEESSSSEEDGEQAWKHIDKSEEHGSCKSNLKVHENGLIVESVENFEPIDLKEQKTEVSKQRRVLNDSNEFGEEYKQKRKRRRMLIHDESDSAEEVIGVSIQKKVVIGEYEIDPLAKASLELEEEEEIPFDGDWKKQEVERLKRNETLDMDTTFHGVRDCNVGVISLASQQGATQPSTSDGQMCENQSYIGARPIKCPIWRGCISAMLKEDKVGINIRAHLSNKASPKVFHAAVVLPSLIIVDVQPKDKLWPKSFCRSPPKDDCIALFLFPEHERDGEVLKGLLDSIHKNDLALKTTVKENVDLLIFSSIELPQPYWKFGSKYYLWGVFVDKCFSHTTPTCSWPISDHNGHGAQYYKSLNQDETSSTTK